MGDSRALCLRVMGDSRALCLQTAVAYHTKMIKEFKGVPGVKPERFQVLAFRIQDAEVASGQAGAVWVFHLR